MHEVAPILLFFSFSKGPDVALEVSLMFSIPEGESQGHTNEPVNVSTAGWKEVF